MRSILKRGLSTKKLLISKLLKRTTRVWTHKSNGVLPRVNRWGQSAKSAVQEKLVELMESKNWVHILILLSSQTYELQVWLINYTCSSGV